MPTDHNDPATQVKARDGVRDCALSGGAFGEC